MRKSEHEGHRVKIERSRELNFLVPFRDLICCLCALRVRLSLE
jgi:hypothetical protein